MTYRSLFDLKPVAHDYSAVFEFGNEVAVGETVNSATTTCVLYTGTDASPSAMISGAAVISGTKATQKIIDGVAGNGYLLTCTALTDESRTLVRSGYLVVT